MRKLFVILSLGLVSVSLGCRHVGGKCDQCAAAPGDASLYAPFQSYRTPVAPVPVPPAVVPESDTPKVDELKKGDMKLDAPKKSPMTPMTEDLVAPKVMPKK